MARNEYPNTDWEQLSLTRPDRVHIRFDVFVIPASGTLGVTTTVWDGVERTLTAMKAQGYEIEGVDLARFVEEISEVVGTHWQRCEPF